MADAAANSMPSPSPSLSSAAASQPNSDQNKKPPLPPPPPSPSLSSAAASQPNSDQNKKPPPSPPPPSPSLSSAAASQPNSDQNKKPPPPSPSLSSAAASQPNSQQNKKPPPPATYVVRIPTDQILRYPPPGNAEKYDKLRRGKNRRGCCCRCALCLLIVTAAMSAGVMYLFFGFKSPAYTVTKLSVHGMNLTSGAPISPGFDVSIRADNPNGKVGIYYLKDSAVNVFYDGVSLGNGVLADFYQPVKNVTVLRVALAGSDDDLDLAVKTALRNAQSRGKVPLVVDVEAPVKFKVGAVKTWEISAKIKCDAVLDRLNEKANIVSKHCNYSVRLW